MVPEQEVQREPNLRQIMNRGSAFADERDQTSQTITRRRNLDDAARIEAESDKSGDQREKTAFVAVVEGKVDEDVALAESGRHDIIG